jgi:hypothetical protein
MEIRILTSITLYDLTVCDVWKISRNKIIQVNKVLDTSNNNNVNSNNNNLMFNDFEIFGASEISLSYV